MHELAITQSVVDMVVERMAGRRVAIVRVRVGELSGVVPDAMRSATSWSPRAPTWRAPGWRSRQPRARAHCRDCGQDFALPDLIMLCPCGSADVQLIGGRELEVASVELVAEPCA